MSTSPNHKSDNSLVTAVVGPLLVLLVVVLRLVVFAALVAVALLVLLAAVLLVTVLEISSRVRIRFQSWRLLRSRRSRR